MGTIQGFCDPGPMRFSVPLFQKENTQIHISSALLEENDEPLAMLLSRKCDAVVSLQKCYDVHVITVPFARETLLLSVPETHPLAQSQKIHLASATPMEMAVYCGEGLMSAGWSRFWKGSPGIIR